MILIKIGQVMVPERTNVLFFPDILGFMEGIKLGKCKLGNSIIPL